MRLPSRLAIVLVLCLIAIPLLAVPTQAQDQEPEPFISLSPISGVPGEDVTVRGYNFDDNEDVDIYYYLNGDRERVAEDETDDDGDFRVSFTVPESYQGLHDVRVYVGGSYEAMDEFAVEPGLRVDPEEGAVGTTVTVKGVGFGEDEEDIEIRYYLDGDYETVADDITADEDGSWEESFNIPSSSSGRHEIDASGDDSSFSDVENTSFEIMPGISMDKSSGIAGDSITVEGTGFEENEEGIEILFDGTVVAQDIKANANGIWDKTFPLPAMPKGGYDVTAEGEETPKEEIRQLSFEVEATLLLSPTTGHVGSELTVSGTGFAANKDIVVKYDASQVATGVTNDKGTFSEVGFSAPKSIHGEHQVTAEDAAGTRLTDTFTMESQAPAKPALISPSNGSRVGFVGSVAPTFEWSVVTDDSGVTYSMQLASSQLFAAPIVSLTGLTQAEYALPDIEALSYGTYYWRVKAIDGAQNDSGWTLAYSFQSGIIPLWGFITGVALLVVLIGLLVYFFVIRRKKYYY